MNPGVSIRPRSRGRPSSSTKRDRARRRGTRTILAIAVLACAATVSAQEAQVRATLNAQGGLWVGQRVILVVELLAPGVFAGAPSFDLPDPKGLLLIPPSDSPVLSNEEIAGTSYTVQRHEVSVFAQQPGEWTIPRLTVRFSFKRNPLDKEVVPAAVTTQPIRLTARVPPGAENLGTILSGRNITAVEAWNPEPGKAKAGDAFTRTITFSAPDIPAMAFPPFPTRPIDGLGIYRKPPEVLDHSDRGQLRGERREVITYVCQRPGHFVIPAARLTWWDLDSNQLRTIDFPGHALDVAPNPAMEAASVSGTPDRRSTLNWIATAVLLLLAVGVLVVRRKQLHRLILRWLAPWRLVHLQPLNPTS